ncbi:hypothetical protein ACTFIU_010771 [Dictyostelium citrinum]
MMQLYSVYIANFSKALLTISKSKFNSSKLQQSLIGFDSSLLEEGCFLVIRGTLSIGGLIQPGQTQQQQYYFLLLTDILLYYLIIDDNVSLKGVKEEAYFFQLDHLVELIDKLLTRVSDFTRKDILLNRQSIKLTKRKLYHDMDQSNINSFQSFVTCTLYRETKRRMVVKQRVNSIFTIKITTIPNESTAPLKPTQTKNSFEKLSTNSSSDSSSSCSSSSSSSRKKNIIKDSC